MSCQTIPNSGRDNMQFLVWPVHRTFARQRVLQDEIDPDKEKNIQRTAPSRLTNKIGQETKHAKHDQVEGLSDRV